MCGFCTRLGFVEPMLCTTSTVQSYVVHHRPVLCTTDLYCAPWCTRGTYTLVVHYIYSFVLIRWCTWWFCMFVMDHHLDGAQCDVVSLFDFLGHNLVWFLPDAQCLPLNYRPTENLFLKEKIIPQTVRWERMEKIFDIFSIHSFSLWLGKTVLYVLGLFCSLDT